MPKSFAFRLTTAFAGVGIVAAALTAIVVNLSFGHTFAVYTRDQTRLRERQVVTALVAAYGRDQRWEPADLASLAPIVLMDGGTLSVQDAAGNTVWSARPSDQTAELIALHREIMGSGPLGPERRLAIDVDGRTIGTAVVRLPKPGLEAHDLAFRAQVNRSLLVGAIIAGLAALAAGVALARRATGPARELTQAAKRAAAGDRHTRVRADSTDEFGEMAEAFNAMAGAIEEGERLRRGFAADVAHELRTPLHILRSQIEAIQDGVAQPDASAVASMHDEVLRITRHVGDLETLASAEASGFSLHTEPIDLRQLLEESTREFSGPYADAGIELQRDLEDVTVIADPARVRQIAANLLSNALKFTPPGGSVTVKLHGDGGRGAVMRVQDTGCGIAPGELPKIFDRFFRGNRSHAGGSGIGLTVVRELVRAHGGTVEAISEPGIGSTFTVRFA